MPNIFKNREQRDRWNVYNNKYAKKNYKTVTIKLSRTKNAEEIAYLENSPLGASGEIRKLLEEKVKGL